MKAVVLSNYGNVENLELAELPVPSIKPGEIRIRTRAISFNPVDTQIRRGLPEGKMVTTNILGRDLSGIVDEVYPGETRFKKGDEVYCYVCNLASSGTYVEYICVPADIVALKPATLSHEEASAVPVAGITAWLALTKLKTPRSRSLFVAGGAGGVGSFAIMLSGHFGFDQVVTTAGNEKSRAYLTGVLGLNEDQILNYRTDDVAAEAIKRNGGYFDGAFDLAGGRMLTVCCKVIGFDGNMASAVDPPEKDDFEFLFQKNGSFHSIGANAYSLSGDRKDWKNYRHMLEALAGLFDNAQLKKPSVQVVGRFSAATVQTAHRLLESGAVQGKLVMSC